jgi:hypothetical protein
MHHTIRDEYLWLRGNGMKDKLILIGAILLAITMLYLGRGELRPLSVLDSNHVYAQMIGVGAKSMGILTDSTTTLAYGTVTNPTTSALTVILTAVQARIYPTATVTLSGTDSANYSATHNCGTTGVAQGATCVVTITFTPPTTTGAKNATATVGYSW